MPIIFAKQRLKERKDAVFLPVDFDYYIGMSEEAMELMKPMQIFLNMLEKMKHI